MPDRGSHGYTMALTSVTASKHDSAAGSAPMPISVQSVEAGQRWPMTGYSRAIASSASISAGRNV
jgi:hypothetical protein